MGLGLGLGLGLGSRVRARVRVSRRELTLELAKDLLEHVTGRACEDRVEHKGSHVHVVLGLVLGEEDEVFEGVGRPG